MGVSFTFGILNDIRKYLMFLQLVDNIGNISYDVTVYGV